MGSTLVGGLARRAHAAPAASLPARGASRLPVCCHAALLPPMTTVCELLCGIQADKQRQGAGRALLRMASSAGGAGWVPCIGLEAEAACDAHGRALAVALAPQAHGVYGCQ